MQVRRIDPSFGRMLPLKVLAAMARDVKRNVFIF